MKFENAKQWIEEIFPDYKKDLAAMIEINSQNADADGNAPFGKGIQNTLEYAVSVAKRMGLSTYIDPAGYYGYADIGEGDTLIGVLGHLDVVPEGDVSKWIYPPFELTEKDGVFYGRGVQDDKGPLLASLYAMHLLLENGVKLTSRVRFIFCTDEESLWRGINAYKEKEEIPSIGFTPDADFPLIYAEKGLVEYNIVSELASDITLSGGTALNAVPENATTPYNQNVEKQLNKLGYQYDVTDDNIVVHGKSVHAKDAPIGVNAITRLAEAFVKAGNKDPMLRFISEKGSDPNGVSIFGAVEDFSGKLTFNLGLAELSKNKQKIGIDIRFPVTEKKETIDAALEKAAAEYGLTVEPFDYLAPVHMDVNSKLVKDLMDAYQSVTGDCETKPSAIGGATFARAAENIIAFGALLPGAEETEHQPNERAKIDDLKIAMEIYIHAFANIASSDA